jgi:hypothetical protein
MITDYFRKNLNILDFILYNYQLVENIYRPIKKLIIYLLSVLNSCTIVTKKNIFMCYPLAYMLFAAFYQTE